MLKIYNTLTRKKEEFKPIHKGKVGMYVCGPTVYDYAHIGNLKSYITADILRRYLEYFGYEVKMIENITDVGHLTADDVAQGDTGEDKIAKKALKEKKTPEEIARFYEDYYTQTIEKMNMLKAEYYPRATAHIDQMIKLIEKLIENGKAYEVNGNIFFDVTSFPDYGKLSNNTLENLQTGARLEEHPDKKNPWDFALWLKAPEDHLMKWPSPWSLGYPGWHIECSAMSLQYLGEHFDIHTGGEDHVFPHHEAEIAQTEGATGKKWVNYWVHTRHMMVDGAKMSKSKGNFYKLEDVMEKGYSPMDLRLALMSSHYKSQMNFTWDALKQAQKNFQRISDFYLNTMSISNKNIPANETLIDWTYITHDFEEAMNDDLNVPQALAVLFELIKETNNLIAADAIDPGIAKIILKIFNKMNEVFGFTFEEKEAKIPDEIIQLAKERKQARENKDYAKSDELRDKIKERGYTLEDTQDGYKIKKS